jgi:hypothetical protein
MQQQPCIALLTVAIHDDQDQAVSGAAVALRGGSTTQTATTDQAGQAQLCASAAGDVRVSVSGQLASGVQLRQLGQDAQGIQFTLSSGEPNQLDLRAEADGSVAPDPATMWAREVNGPPVSTVVVPTSAAQLQPTQPALILTAPEAAAPIATQAAVAVPSQPVATTPAPSLRSSLLVAAVLVVLLLIVTLVLLRVKPVRPYRAEF